jgi:hypothetical protein
MNRLLAAVGGVLLAGGAAAQAPDTAAPARRDSVAARPVPPAFQVRMVGRIQTLYQHTSPARAVAESGPVAGDTSLFRVHRARVGFTGWVGDPRLEFELQADLAGQSAFLRRAWAGWRLRGDAAQLRAGRFIMPFGRQQMTPLFSQPTADRVSLAETFGRGHDDGAMVWGLPAKGRVEYYAGVFNGDGFNRNTQQDASNLWVARAVAAPLGRLAYTGSALGAGAPRVAVGASASRNRGALHDLNAVRGIQTPTRACTASACTTDWGDDAVIRTAGADVALRWRGTQWMAETFRRELRPRADTLPAVHARGWYAQGGALVVPGRVEVGARYARLVPNRARPDTRVAETNPFAIAYLRGHDVKVMADWLHTRETAPAGPATTRRARVSMLVTF